MTIAREYFDKAIYEEKIYGKSQSRTFAWKVGKQSARTFPLSPPPPKKEWGSRRGFSQIKRERKSRRKPW